MIVGAALLAGCSPDYSAVRDWSSQAREAVLPLQASRVASDPALLPPPPAPVTAEGRAGAVQALNEGIASWLGLLAYLADDGWPRQRENPLTALAEKVQPFDPEGAAALTNLGEIMGYTARRNTRAPYLRTAIQLGDPHLQAAVAALQRQSSALLAEAPQPAIEAPALPRNATPQQRAALQDLVAARRAELDRQRPAEDARRAALERVAAGHAWMAANTSVLSQSEAARLLRAQESELRRLMLLGVAG
ncbi:hypothetical protein [Falsiroseomonas oryziterrae]|uniref:hypothetical protein n=1 Tax=Falsiroseomonas oryziterrae TaxID=2911368 RepID=UPI001F343210|nr:hypothetical protein [Roseomonas sp. NPKOSM-4]